ncbi:hypothetical protein ABTM49_20290, partial [Acinetobacter baumannii]
MNLDDRYQLESANVRFENVTNWLLARLPPGARVLEIGPANQPVAAATHLVARLPWSGLDLQGRAFAQVDVEVEPLPFADDTFDLV